MNDLSKAVREQLEAFGIQNLEMFSILSLGSMGMRIPSLGSKGDGKLKSKKEMMRDAEIRGMDAMRKAEVEHLAIGVGLYEEKLKKAEEDKENLEETVSDLGVDLAESKEEILVLRDTIDKASRMRLELENLVSDLKAERQWLATKLADVTNVLRRKVSAKSTRAELLKMINDIKRVVDSPRPRVSEE